MAIKNVSRITENRKLVFVSDYNANFQDLLKIMKLNKRTAVRINQRSNQVGSIIRLLTFLAEKSQLEWL